MHRRGLALVLVGGSALLVGLSIASAGAPQGKAWVDAPLEPATLLVGETLTVTAHATDPEGVDRMLLLVDEEAADVQGVDGGTLESRRLFWTPTQPGTYGLSVWGSTEGGRMSAVPGVITVTVMGRTPTTTMPSQTTMPPQTTTTVPCDPMVITAPPLLTPANNATGVNSENVYFSWGMPGCSIIHEFDLEVSANADMSNANPYSIELPATSHTAEVGWCQVYWRVRAQRFDTTGPWSPIRTFTTDLEC